MILSLSLRMVFSPAKVDIGWCDVVQALVVALIVVIVDESPDLPFQIAGQIVVLKQDLVLHHLMPVLDLALCLRVMRSPANMIHALVFQPVGQIARDVG